ncbi:hypothetical protein H6G89_32565 [Oscillatoria sp. FACHB-1407]|uniref:hypothetical protein n=1 Tax=Oscillatoria sp. FACHB-1407 TaxID=2692847 RepID=UPI001684EEF6|nr:hypothetical protein [Oscillatoria sp. FACHB-1407]MBD2465723.1 hypothetical protein [Oscillatoria sp. FACHB-1407]
MPTDNEYLRLIYNGMPGAKPSGVNTSQLNAANQSTQIDFEKRSRLSVGYQISGISGTLTLRLEGRMSATDANWYPLSATGQDISRTANGNYFFSWEGTAFQVRVLFVSGTGTVLISMRVD